MPAPRILEVDTRIAALDLIPDPRTLRRNFVRFKHLRKPTRVEGVPPEVCPRRLVHRGELRDEDLAPEDIRAVESVTHMSEQTNAEARAALLGLRYKRYSRY